MAIVTAETAIDAAYGITDWLAIEGRFSLRVVRVKPTYTEVDGRPKVVTDDIHHHDETLTGITDPWLILRFAAARDRFIAAARIGVAFPVGSTVPNPYALGEAGQWHQHIQFGSGTFSPILGLGLSYSFELPKVADKPAWLGLDGSALGIFGVYENDRGFRLPSRIFPSVRATLSLLDGALNPYVTVDVPYESPERWSGVLGQETGPDGRADLLLGVGLGWVFAKPWRLDVGFRGRAASLTKTPGFNYPGLVIVALGTSFDVGGNSSKKAGTDGRQDSPVIAPLVPVPR